MSAFSADLLTYAINLIILFADSLVSSRALYVVDVVENRLWLPIFFK